MVCTIGLSARAGAGRKPRTANSGRIQARTRSFTGAPPRSCRRAGGGRHAVRRVPGAEEPEGGRRSRGEAAVPGLVRDVLHAAAGGVAATPYLGDRLSVGERP